MGVYERIDSIIRQWAEANRLRVATRYPEEEV
jgi:hypothetical protein